MRSMSGRDAFGNEQGEDSLGAMGWTHEPSEDGTTGPDDGRAADPAPVVTGGADAGPGWAPGPTGRSAPPAGAREPVRGGVVIGLVVLALVGAGVAQLVAQVSGGVDEVRRVISTVRPQTSPAPAGEPQRAPGAAAPSTPAAGGPDSPPAGFGTGSLLLRANFARAMTALRREGARASSIRVAADRIDASIVTTQGRAKQVQYRWDGSIMRFGDPRSGTTLTGTFALADLDRRAAFRLARSAAGRAKRSPSSVDYLVALDVIGSGDPTRWVIFLKNGRGRYVADAHGRITRTLE